ncbi:MAG TPA: polyprenyl synthetase family protein [Candidatus Hydrogenedentes bacterium]|nr:polyprenyl synthetase family protein [Candidatus Hydrogenedentota bacterium]
MSERLLQTKAFIDQALDACLPSAEEEPRLVHEAMHYAVLGGGKRLRPLLTLGVCEVAGAPPERVIDAACAVELAHTASLVLDDLPCMDDAATRRGRPCTHIQYGKATAILTAIGLLARAFDLLAHNAQRARPAVMAADAVAELAAAVGTRGLVCGQHMDLMLRGGRPSLDELEQEHRLKAGVLFIAAVRIPALLLNLSVDVRACLDTYARGLGLAFQVIDDLVDARAPREDAGKTTFETHLGSGGARRRAHALITQAAEALAPLGEDAGTLRRIAEHVRANIES